MNLGICKACRQRNELHGGRDGMGYCESCLKNGADLDNRFREPNEEKLDMLKPSERDFTNASGPALSHKQELLDFIISHVDSNWIDNFLISYMEQLKQSYGWVNVLQNIDNELILFRMATELGYGKIEPETTLDYLRGLTTETVSTVVEGIDKRAKYGKKSKGRKSKKVATGVEPKA